MSDWKETTIGELLTLQRGHDLVQTEFINGQYLVAGSNGPIGYHNKYTTKGPGLTIGRSGNSIGVAHFYENDFWAHNTVLYSKAFHDSDPKFVYFLLKSFDFKSFDGGSAVPTLNRNHINPTLIKVPVDINEQKSIANILSSLDDKIELLNRQNKTLEALAETLFRQWFIEEADERGEEISIDQIGDFLNGLACQKYPPINEIEKLPVIKIKEMNSGFSDKSDYVSSHIESKYLVEPGDILFSWSGSLDLCIWPYEKGVLNQHLFKVTSLNYPKWFYFFVIKYHLPEFKVIAESKSTTMGHIQRHHLTDAKFKKPSKKLLIEKNEIIEPFFSKIILNHTEIRTLTQLRDTLLPKLMSGEVRVEG